MKRKSVTEDAGVRAAVEALKAAILAVNGDDEVVSLVTVAAVRRGNGIHLVSDTHTCLCRGCLTRTRDQFFECMLVLARKGVSEAARAVH